MTHPIQTLQIGKTTYSCELEILDGRRYWNIRGPRGGEVVLSMANRNGHRTLSASAGYMFRELPAMKGLAIEDVGGQLRVVKMDDYWAAYRAAQAEAGDMSAAAMN